MGMCAVAGSSRRIFMASIPLMPGRLMSIRITSGRWARASSMPALPFAARQQAHVRAARDELLDQLQIRRIVLDIEQGAQRCAAAGPVLAATLADSASPTSSCGLGRRRSVRSRTRCPRRRCFPRRSRPPSVRPVACSPPGRCRCLPRALASCPRRLNGWNSCASFSGDKSRAGILDADAYAVRGRSRRTSTTTVPPAWLYLIALESRLIRTCFSRVRSALTKQGMSNSGKVMRDAALLRLRFDHGLAFEHDFGQRHRFQRQRQLARTRSPQDRGFR